MPKRKDIKRNLIIGRPLYRNTLVALVGTSILMILCSPMLLSGCSVDIATEIVVNHLKGNIRLNGGTHAGTVELERVARSATKTLRTVTISDRGDFDLGALAVGKFKLKIRLGDQVLILPLLVTHVREENGYPVTFLDADLHSPVGTDCNAGHWTFDSHLVAGIEE